MPRYFTVTNTNDLSTLVINDSEFTQSEIEGQEAPKNILLSNDNNYLAAVSRLYVGRGGEFPGYLRSAGYVMNLTTRDVVMIIGQFDNPTLKNVEVRMDASSRFGCYTEQSCYFACFELATGSLINVAIPDEFRNYVWVSSVFSPNQPKLYLIGYDRRETEMALGKSAILVIETAGWTTLEIIWMPFVMVMDHGFGYGDHSSLSINSDGTELYIPNLNSTNAIYNLTTRQLSVTGYAADERMNWGRLNNVVTLKSQSEKGVFIYPNFERITYGDPDSYIEDLSIEAGGVSVGNWPWTGAPQQFINTYPTEAVLREDNFYDPSTKLRILTKLRFVEQGVLNEGDQVNTPLEYYIKVCQNLGLDHTAIVSGVNYDDVAMLRDTNVSPFGGGDYVGPFALKFAVSADGGFGLYLRDPVEVSSYVSPLGGTDDEYLPRAAFVTQNPPFLTLNAKPKNWDMQIVEYREQKTPTATIAYVKMREVYGNYPDEIETVIYFDVEGRLDFVTGMDYHERQRVRFIVMDETNPSKNATELFGGYTTESRLHELTWFSNFHTLPSFPT